MNNARHPNFYLGLVTFILLFAGIGFRANGYQGGSYILWISLVLGGIHWIWAIMNVLSDFKVNSPKENRILWVILVIALPPVGGMLYYIMSKTVRM